MMQLLGTLILIWLAIGFLVGTKIIYFDNWLEELKVKVENGDAEFPEGTEHFYENIKDSKLFFLAFFTLFGLLSFIGDTKRTFSRKG